MIPNFATLLEIRNRQVLVRCEDHDDAALIVTTFKLPNGVQCDQKSTFPAADLDARAGQPEDVVEDRHAPPKLLVPSVNKLVLPPHLRRR